MEVALVNQTRLLMRFLALFLFFPSLLYGDNSSNLSRYAKGVFAEQNRDWKTAREHYQPVQFKAPNVYPLTQKLVSLLSFRPQEEPASQDLAGAAELLEKFATNNLAHLGAQLDYVSFLKQHFREDTETSKKILQTLELAYENFPENPRLSDLLISGYEEASRRDDSLRILDKQLESTSSDPTHWLTLIPIIQTLYPAESLEYAAGLKHAMERLSQTGLKIPSIARRISEYHRERGQMDQAITTLEEHLALTPSSHSLRTRLGLLYLSSRNEAMGEKILREVIAIDPDQALAHTSLTKLHRKREEPLLALSHRAEVLRIRSGSPEEAIEIANEYLDLADPHAARLLLEKFRFKHPEHAGVLARLAMATHRDGEDSQKSSRLFQQAEALAQENSGTNWEKDFDSDFYLGFAKVLVQKEDFGSAEKNLRQAAQSLDLDTEPERYAQAITSLAELWILQNKNEAPAKALLERALALDPNNVDAARLLK